jgi:polyketide synthase PksJ
MSNVIELIWSQVSARPDAIAIRQEGTVLTYAELANQVDCWANYLIGRKDYKEQQVVATLFARTPTEIIGVLATLKAGLIALPLDPEWPKERNAQILEHSQTTLVLCDNTARGQVALPTHCNMLDITGINENNTKRSDSQNRAKSSALALLTYITVNEERCKAVGLKHIQLGLLMQALQTKPGFDHNCSMALISSPASQWSFTESILPLCSGGVVEIPTPPRLGRTGQTAPDKLLPRLEQCTELTHLQISTDLLTRCLETSPGWPTALPTQIWLGGEHIHAHIYDIAPPEMTAIWHFIGLPETGGWIKIIRQFPGNG